MNKKELSERSGLSLRMIQFYTEEGIIPCLNVNAGRGKPRIYNEEFGAIAYVKSVKSLHDIGMSISKIKKLKENGHIISASYIAEKILRLMHND